jgi:TfoX/Sxy family transcriptional regulator of competence genes
MEDDPLHESLVARLGEVGEITSRSMFGGIGIDRNGKIFGIVFRDRMYQKVGDEE